MARNVRLQCPQTVKCRPAHEACIVSALDMYHHMDLESAGGRERSITLLTFIQTFFLNAQLFDRE